MASITKRGNRWRALVRRGGRSECATFGSKKLAEAWAATIEQETDQLKAKGYIDPKGMTFGALVDRYIDAYYPQNLWGRSKAADLKLLKAEFGKSLVSNLDQDRLLRGFNDMHRAGAGGVTISARVGYLVAVMRAAKNDFRLLVPLEAAESTRDVLSKRGLIKKSAERGRRVTDAELERIVAHVECKATAIPFRDIVFFSVASAMRISETCRMLWVDLNEADKTVRIRDRKHPSQKIGNHQIVPLLENLVGHNAFALVTKQPRTAKRVFPVNPRTVSDYFTEAVAQLEIEDLHLHDLRHEAISRLFEAGYRIEEVSVFSGHRDWSMLKRYTHLKAANLHKPRAA